MRSRTGGCPGTRGSGPRQWGRQILRQLNFTGRVVGPCYQRGDSHFRSCLWMTKMGVANFYLTTARLSRRYNSPRPHRLAGPGQRPFTPSTGVQIPLGTPTRNQGTCSNAGAFFSFLYLCTARYVAETSCNEKSAPATPGRCSHTIVALWCLARTA